MFEPLIFFVVCGTFLLAGLVKGVIGLGLPTVGLAILAVATDLPNAMALLVVPSLVTNILQMVMGGNFRHLVCRLWSFMLMAGVTVWIGVSVLVGVDLALLTMLLGALLMVYASICLTGFNFMVSTRHELWVGAMAGSLSGVLTGMTGTSVPGVLFLQSLGLTRNQLIQAMGMLFTVSTLALGVALEREGLFTLEQGALSASAVVPAFIGMLVGWRLRRALSQRVFRRVFFSAILILGAYLVVGAR